MRAADVAVIGGGIVGLATGYEFARRAPGTRVVVLEKEARLAAHQTGRNSGVIHSGVYYKPGSLKAANCRRGKALLEAFCREHDIAFEICGKVIVAVDEGDRPRLEDLARRAHANGVVSRRIDRTELHRLEPHADGIDALHVPETGIVDYVGVCERLAAFIRVRGGEVVTEMKVDRIRSTSTSVVLAGRSGEVEARLAVNCAGLHSDRVLQRAGETRPARIVPFRGEYYELTPSAAGLVRNLIYPVPDPSFPFLGVHFTRMVTGGVECGPNAVLALAREGYEWDDVRILDLVDILTFSGFWRMAFKHWRREVGEVQRSLSKRAFTRALRRLLPDIRSEHLNPAPAGVRAQAVSGDGSLVDDFLVRVSGRVVHVLNAPSPAATASLAIAESIVDKGTPLL
jgi:(S)-2-hydroxyglutarate dehydrogenase